MKQDKKIKKKIWNFSFLIDRSLTKKKKRRENCNAIFSFVNLQGLYLGHRRRSASLENLSRCDALSFLPLLVFFSLTIQRITKKQEESNPFLVIYDRNTIQPVRVTVSSRSFKIVHNLSLFETHRGWRNATRIVLRVCSTKNRKKNLHIREIYLCEPKKNQKKINKNKKTKKREKIRAQRSF